MNQADADQWSRLFLFFPDYDRESSLLCHSGRDPESKKRHVFISLWIPVSKHEDDKKLSFLAWPGIHKTISSHKTMDPQIKFEDDKMVDRHVAAILAKTVICHCEECIWRSNPGNVQFFSNLWIAASLHSSRRQRGVDCYIPPKADRCASREDICM